MFHTQVVELSPDRTEKRHDKFNHGGDYYVGFPAQHAKRVTLMQGASFNDRSRVSMHPLGKQSSPKGTRPSIGDFAGIFVRGMFNGNPVLGAKEKLLLPREVLDWAGIAR